MPERIRSLLPHLQLGDWPTGPKNSITDVCGVLVRTKTIQHAATGPHGAVNTGVTAILPRKDFLYYPCFAGIFRFNGNGELTGSHWIEETGLLNSPIILTGTLGIGAAHQGVYEYGYKQDHEKRDDWLVLPVVAETYDGWLCDVERFAVKPEHVVSAIESATDEAVPEGNTGGGTGMVCHRFKGGTGSSSRVISGLDGSTGAKKEYVVGVLVQANYGRKEDLRIDGVPIGRLLLKEEAENSRPEIESKARQDGSIIIVTATDAPLHPLQLQRLAKRSTVGLAKVGGYGRNSSGDIFIAFSTANKETLKESGSGGGGPFQPRLQSLEALDDGTIDGLFEGVQDATEEAIYNALCGAETMIGFKDRKIEALPLDRVKKLMEKYHSWDFSGS